ncbi:mediator of RNA polymerase II transcription subunit 28-like [Carassius gibelio]|uniref:mediator of RNA polymerase II transcription subunit 28-like n=1 Tax=Carassius gibelio TaxID=101364 RepID=UPI002277750C|nr:mediator of RNA polymerase II transcription subunit 28-like [Carassius gibelio]
MIVGAVVSGQMALSMGGMFPGQHPPGPHAPAGPGGPGQPWLLTAPSGNRGTNNTLADELEASFQDASELKNELQRKEMLIQKHLTKIHHWQQVLEDINVQHKKPTELPQSPLASLEQASTILPAPLKPN